MFEDLIPSASAQTSAPPPGLFDDLIPPAGAAGVPSQADAPSAPSDASSSARLFVDLIPNAAASGAAGAMSSETAPSVGSVLKQFAIGIPEGAMNMAGAVHDAMTGQMLQHAIVRGLFGEPDADALAPAMGKLLHDALPSALNPQNYPAHNLAERVARGVGEGMPAVAIPGGPIAGRILTQGLAGATGALAAEAAPEPYKDAAQLAGNLIGASIPALRSAIINAIKRVGVPPEHIDPADIEGLARSVTRRDLLTFKAFKRQVTGDAVERGFLTPEEVEQTYGKGTADEYRGSSTPENGPAPPPQSAERGGPGSVSPEGQQLPGPGENGGGSAGPVGASAEAASSSEPKPRGPERATGAEPLSPPEREASRANDTRTTPNASGSEEAVRSGEVTPQSVQKNLSDADDIGTTGPPPDQGHLPQDGAPSGAVSVSGRGEELPPRRQLPADRIKGYPEELGRGPIGDDGYALEGHHQGQVHGGVWVEITRTEHRLGKNFKRLHANTGQEKSKIDPNRRKREAYAFWSKDQREGRFDHLPRLPESEKIQMQDAAKARLKEQDGNN
jgi:HNH/ENDO VII superfamily nuclease